MIIMKRVNVLIINVLRAIMSCGYCMANTTTADVDALFTTTILATDHRYRPTLNQSHPTVVYISLMMLSLTDIDEVQQSMTCNVQLILNWVDDVRKWDPNDYDNVTKVHPDPLDTWRPRLFLSNSISDRDMFKDDYAPLTIYNNGQTEWLPGGIVYTSCYMKMAHFPFDTQTCSLSFTTGDNSDTIQLLPTSPKISFANYHRNGEWVIKSSEVISSFIDGKSNVMFLLKLNRLPAFTLLNVVIPVTIISSLSSLVFIMPAASGESVSFSVTVLLSLTVYTGEITKDLPTNSDSLPLLIVYLICFLLHSSFTILANLFVLILYNHRTAATKNKNSSDSTRNSDQNSPTQTSFKKNSSCSQVNHRNSSTWTTHSDYHLQDFNFEIMENSSCIFSMCRLEKNRLPAQFNLNDVNRDIASGSRAEKFSFESNYQINAQIGSSLGQPGEGGVSRDDCENQNRNNVFVRIKSSSVFTYISVIDTGLFVLFFSVWLIVTIVFMTLMACGTSS